MIAAMNTPTFPPTGDFTFTDDLRGSVVVQEDVAAECFVLRDEHATHIVISTPVLACYQVGSVSKHLSAVMHSALVALHSDVREPITFYECHAAAENTAASCVLVKISLDGQGQVRKEQVPGYVAAELIERCFAVSALTYQLRPSADVQSALRKLSSEGLGQNVVRLPKAR